MVRPRSASSTPQARASALFRRGPRRNPKTPASRQQWADRRPSGTRSLSTGCPVAIEAGPLLLGRDRLEQRLGGRRISALGDLFPDPILESLGGEPSRQFPLLAQ